MSMPAILTPSGVTTSTPFVGFHHLVRPCPMAGMDIKAIRLANLRRLLREQFADNQTDLGLATGRKQQYFSDVLTPERKKSFGEKVCRAIEKRLDLPPLWFDQSHSGEGFADFETTSPWPFPFTADQWHAVPDEQRAVIVDAMISAVRRSAETPASRGRRKPGPKS